MKKTLLIGALLGAAYPATAQEFRQPSAPSNLIAAVTEPEKQMVALPPPPARSTLRSATGAVAIDPTAPTSRAAEPRAVNVPVPIPPDRPSSAPPREAAPTSLLASITEGLFSPKLMGWQPEQRTVTAQADTAPVERAGAPSAAQAAPSAPTSVQPVRRAPARARPSTPPAVRSAAAAAPADAAVPPTTAVRPGQLPQGVSPNDFQDWQSEPHLPTGQVGPGARTAPVPVRAGAPVAPPVGAAADRKPSPSEQNAAKPAPGATQTKPASPRTANGAEPKPAAAGKPAPATAAAESDTEAAQFCSNITNAAADARIAWQQDGLKKAEDQLRERITELEKKRAEYEQWLKRREDFLKKAEDNVVQIYSRMKPDAAAVQLAGMLEETAAAVLVKLSPRNSSAILNEMEPGRAAHLANTLAGMHRANDGVASK